MADLFSRRERRGRGARDFSRDEEDVVKSDGGLIGWMIFIVLLVGLVALCWMGSIYIFGHPEEPLSYSLLHRLNKLEPPKRFIDTQAPKGEFLGADKLLERFGSMGKREMEKESARLLREYIRNYDSVKGLVPYVIGNFEILDSYELTPNDFFTSGVVAVAQDSKQPQVLIEHVFTADEKVVPIVHRNLLTGQPIVLERSRNARDLAAIVGVSRLDDGRMKFTVVPISYPGYAAAQGPGSFNLEPPKSLNVEAGLPILSKGKQEEADARFATWRRRSTRPETGAEEDAPGQLVRIQPAMLPDGTVPEPAPTPAVAEAVPPTPEPTPEEPVLAEATPEPEVRPAIPVATPVVAAATPIDEAGDVPLKPFIAGQAPTPAPAAPIANTAAGSWRTYRPGQMPRGRLVGVRDAKTLADGGAITERIYLQGNFVVTARTDRSAVLRARGAEGTGARVWVEFPAGSAPPTDHSEVVRGRERPFLITSVERGLDGTVNIKVQEVTTPE